MQTHIKVLSSIASVTKKGDWREKLKTYLKHTNYKRSQDARSCTGKGHFLFQTLQLPDMQTFQSDLASLTTHGW